MLLECLHLIFGEKKNLGFTVALFYGFQLHGPLLVRELLLRDAHMELGLYAERFSGRN